MCLKSQHWIQTGSTLNGHAEFCSTAAIAPEQGGQAHGILITAATVVLVLEMLVPCDMCLRKV